MTSTDMAALRRTIVCFTTALLAAATAATAAGEESGSTAAESGDKPGSVTVESYETRPEPTHEVSLHDGRVYFLKELEKTETGYVLHTLEDEIIEVDKDEVADLKKLQ